MITTRFLMTLCIALVLICCVSCLSKKIGSPLPSPPAPVAVISKDSDDDNILDVDDKCPNVAGVSRYQGCPIPDTDGDGVNDEEDKCINIEGKKNNFGCPEITDDDQVGSAPPDTDKDKVPNYLDKCPDVPGPKSNMGCPLSNENNVVEKDSDSDGVPDSKDKCPFEKGSITKRGCPQSPVAIVDTPRILPPVVPARENSPPNATISYSYFDKIKFQATKDIRVLLQIDSSRGIVEQRLRVIENEEQQAKVIRGSDTNTIKSLTLKGYKLITVALEYDKSDFEVKSVNTEEQQELDSINGNYWHWRVKAITEKQSSEIVIKVKAENPGVRSTQKDSRIIPVKVIIDNIGGLRRTWNWVLNNPQYSIPSIIVPFFIFIFRRRKKNNNEKE